MSSDHAESPSDGSDRERDSNADRRAVSRHGELTDLKRVMTCVNS